MMWGWIHMFRSKADKAFLEKDCLENIFNVQAQINKLFLWRVFYSSRKLQADLPVSLLASVIWSEKTKEIAEKNIESITDEKSSSGE